MPWSREDRIIGGPFGVVAPVDGGLTAPPPAWTDAFCMVNARSCLLVVLETVHPERVWLPSYLCPVLIDVCEQAGVEYAFYEVTEALACIDPADLDLRPRDLVVVIHYLGFLNPFASAVASDGRAGWLVEDATQALLTDGIGQTGDVTLFSPRKYIGVPDGGFLVQRHEIVAADLALTAPPRDWWRTALMAGLIRREFDLGTGDTRWYEQWRSTGMAQPIGRYRMSDLTHAIAFGGTDFAAVAERRRANYRYLAERLGDVAMLPELPGSATPVGFPIRLADREGVRGYLFERSIHAPVHWRPERRVPAHFTASRSLGGEILTLPCDQRYDEADMDRLVAVLREAMGRSRT